MTKHFLKTLTIFAVMIVLGLLGVFLVSYFNQEDNSKILDNVGVAK